MGLAIWLCTVLAEQLDKSRLGRAINLGDGRAEIDRATEARFVQLLREDSTEPDGQTHGRDPLTARGRSGSPCGARRSGVHALHPEEVAHPGIVAVTELDVRRTPL